MKDDNPNQHQQEDEVADNEEAKKTMKMTGQL
jgi:hypothetical protein